MGIGQPFENRREFAITKNIKLRQVEVLEPDLGGVNINDPVAELSVAFLELLDRRDELRADVRIKAWDEAQLLSQEVRVWLKILIDSDDVTDAREAKNELLRVSKGAVIVGEKLIELKPLQRAELVALYSRTERSQIEIDAGIPGLE
jgi:hypothetical protein